MRNIHRSRVLIVDDNQDILTAAKILLGRSVGTLETETNPERLPELLARHSYDVILLDMNFTRDITSGGEGFYWLERIIEIDPASIVILITAYGDVDTAVKAIKYGATDFVLKPWQNEKLCATVSSAIELSAARRESSRRRQQQQQLSSDIDRSFSSILGVCDDMQRLFQTIERVSATDANVLILGENGTGKEMVAREIHRQSQRAGEVFLSVDVGSLTESLFESELFGHVRGAFTGANKDRAGRFELAEGGTVFLDEIANIPGSLQSKLLSVLENRKVTRVGGSSEVDIDIRLISATNSPLREKMSSGEFREDLYYRINTVEIQLPPLRDRDNDFLLLARHFLSHYSRKYKKQIDGINDATIKQMKQYGWPGNIRELKHAIERAVIMNSSGTIEQNDLALTRNHTVDSMVSNDQTLLQQEEVAVIRALDRNRGNVSLAAKQLGITRASFYRRMKKYGL